MARGKTRKRRGTHGSGSVRKTTSGRFQARWKDDAGRYHPAPSTFDNESDAWDWLSARRQGYISTPKSGRYRDGLTLAEFSETWLETRKARGKGRALSPRTRKDYASLLDRIILPTFGHRRLDSIKKAEVHHWWESLPSDNPVQNAHAYSLLSSIMSTAEKRDLIEKSPCVIEGAGRSPAKARPAIATVEQIGVIVENIPERYRVMVLVAAWCGLRSGELRALQRRDFRETKDGAFLAVERGVVTVEGKFLVGRPKSEAGHRVVPVPKSLVPALKDHLQTFSEPGKEGLIFPALQGGFMHPSTMQKVWKKAAAAADRPELRLHDMRHAAGTRAAQAGATLAELMRFLGDSSVQAVMRYQHAEDARMNELGGKLDDMKKGRRKFATSKR